MKEFSRQKSAGLMVRYCTFLYYKRDPVAVVFFTKRQTF